MSDADLFVLAAGFGTRMRPLTERLPKPLVPVCGVPLLAYALAHGHRHGARRALVNAHWCASALAPWQGVHEGVRVDIVEEVEILGTGGGLRNVAHRLAPRFLVLNGDVLSALDLGALRDRLPDGGAALALRVSPDDAASYGVVRTDARQRVVGLRRYEAPAEPPIQADAHFTGLYAMDHAALTHVGPGMQDIAATAFPALMRHGRLVGWRSDALWLDLGDPKAYRAANLAVLRGEAEFALDPMPRAAFACRPGCHWGHPPPGVRFTGACWVGRGARVDPRAVLEDAVIGAGAMVGPVRLRRSVVWEGVEVGADIDDGVAWANDKVLAA